MAITVTVNGKAQNVEADGDTPLLYALRNDLELNGAKYGCGFSQCGACTVIVDGRAVRSCVTLLSAVAGKAVTTIEGLGAGEIVINSIDHDGMMDGYDLKLARAVRDRVSLPLSFVGGAASVEDMAALIGTVGKVGAGAGSMFVFNGPYRAVLISYARPANAGTIT